MTKEEQRIAIAEKCGLTNQTYYCGYCREVKTPTKFDGDTPIGNCSHKLHRDIPNYPEDLNAMHEAEKVLTEADFVIYCNTLNSICCNIKCGGKNQRCGWTISATAAQRSEAFCRTFWPEKWVEK